MNVMKEVKYVFYLEIMNSQHVMLCGIVQICIIDFQINVKAYEHPIKKKKIFS